VRAREEFQEQRPRFELAQLEAQAFLVARVDLPVRLHALRLPRAQRVACGRLDLDHFRAEITEHLRERVARYETRKVEHADPLQRAFGVRLVVSPGECHVGIRSPRHVPGVRGERAFSLMPSGEAQRASVTASALERFMRSSSSAAMALC
jgi:hypothetical protein